MPDIVDRLKAPWEQCDGTKRHNPLELEAAQVIECLRKELEQVKLSTMQRLYLNHVRLYGEITVSEIVKETKCSAQSASGILRAIHRKGYLSREERKQESGGTEYVYTPKQPI